MCLGGRVECFQTSPLIKGTKHESVQYETGQGIKAPPPTPLTVAAGSTGHLFNGRQNASPLQYDLT